MATKATERRSTASLKALANEAEGCTRCDLYRNATQTVFGEGRKSARIVFVGEQPGDKEDTQGRPFVGPAGRLFDAILEEARVERKKTYVTNAVKHFKFEPGGKRRIHSKPNAGEIKACRWWLDKELAAIKPDVAVALGSTAARALVGRPIAVTKLRGTTLESAEGIPVFVTVHPSYLLRIPNAADKAAERRRFVEEMREVRKLMKE